MTPIHGVDVGYFLQLWTTDGGEVGSQVETIQAPPFLQQGLGGPEDRSAWEGDKGLRCPWHHSLGGKRLETRAFGLKQDSFPFSEPLPWAQEHEAC